MSWLDNFVVAVRGTTSNKLRSALTMLGVLIGVASVIILVAVGNGSRAAVAASLKSLGTNTLTVSSTGRFGRGPATGGTQSQQSDLTQQDVEQIGNSEYAPDVASVSPVIETSVDVAYSDASDTSVSVYGSTPSYLSAGDYTIEAGSSITSSEVNDRSRDVIIGQTVLSDLFASGTNPIGQTLILDDTTTDVSASFQIVGVLASKGSSSGIEDPNNVIIAPYTAVQDQLTGEASTFSQLIVVGKSASTLDAAETEVEDVLATNADTTVADLPFTVLNEAQLLSTAESTSNTLTVFLAFVAAGALVIGGIGLMNIMLVTVTERTREIGIRKAIGAPRGVIIGQFLTEAVLLSVLGGAVGVVAGIVGSRFKIDGTVPVVATWSIALAFGVSIVVGVVFGLYPAAKAAGLRPIDALRYE
ncbi:MAG TPA: ABC transporter permease [Acidimicrobiales bacterium]|nr:ABC transporter permease [Acidimicrobiales bacterium]